MSSFSLTDCPPIHGGFKLCLFPFLTKNFKEIKCSLVNSPFLLLYFSLIGLQQTFIYNPLTKGRKEWVRGKSRRVES